MATHPGLEGPIENDRRGPLRLVLKLDAILYPTSGGLEQVGLLAEALRNTGFLPAHDHG